MTASANFDIRADDKTAAAFAGVNKKLKELGSVALKAGAVAGTTIAGIGIAIVGLSVSAARNAKEMTAYARAMGVSTSELSAWGYASNTVSVSQEKLNDILKDTSEKIGDAYANKGGEAVEILERLNLNAKDMASLSPDQQILKIAESLNQVGTQSEKVLILESLASDASLLIPLLENNAEKLKELTNEAHTMGVSLNDIDAAKIEAANNAWAKTLSIIEGVGQKIAAKFSPYVVELADRFGNASIEANGFTEAIESGMKTATIAVAYFGNVLYGLNAIWKSVKLVFQGFAAGLFNTLDQLQQHIVSVVNLMPGVDIKPIESLSAMTRQANEDFNKTRETLVALVKQPMPSTAIQEYFDKVDERVSATAEKISAVVNTKNLSADSVSDSGFDQTSKLESLLSSYEDEYVLLEQKHTNELFLLDQAFLAEEISKEKHEQTMLSIGERFATSRRKLDDYETKKKVDAFQSMFGNLSLLMESKNKEMFEVGKAAAITNTIISTYSSAQKAYDSMAGIPIVGPGLGAIAAGAAIAVGLQRVSAIKSISFGSTSASGGSTGSGSIGGAPVNNSLPPPPQDHPEAAQTREPKNISITVEGNPSKQQVRDLMDAIGEEIKDGYNLSVTIA